MAIVKMKRIELVGLNSERKRLIEYLQQCGNVDISDSKCDILESRETVRSISQIEANMAQVAAAMAMLPNDSGGFFAKRKETDKGNYALEDGEFTKTMAIVKALEKIRKTKEKNKEELAALEDTENILKSFTALDVPTDFRGTRKTSVKIGVLEGEYTEDMLWQRLSENELDAVYFEILSKNKQQTLVWILYLAEDETKMAAFSGKINLMAPKNLPKTEPKKRLDEIKKRKKAIAEENAECDKKLKDFYKERGKLELLYDRLSIRRDKYLALQKIGITDTAFFITGYVPESEADGLKQNLEKLFTVSASIEEPCDSEDVPVKFKNNAFVEPVEGITSDYSMPSKNDIDPNPIMAFFYYFFFGMMFSDAGYGLLLIIVCGLLGFGSFIDKTKRRAYRMFFYCGISTTVWGILYGSFFGDMIATVSKTFGTGQLAFSPILVDPVGKPLTVLIMSVAFGAVHILAAMAIKFHITWKSGDKLAAVFDTGFWMLVILGIGILSCGAAFKMEVVLNIGKYMAIGGAVGLVLTQGRTSKNPILKLFNGILSLYDITSIIGDVLSYSRLMALGLATGVIASVINVLGSLGGGGAVGLISFIAISIFGHTLNFAINMLGAYVHTNRLQYVEFYQKFYEGGGKKYKPLNLETKYYEFK